MSSNTVTNSSNKSSSLGQLGNSLVRVFFRIYPVSKPKWDLVKIKDNSRIYVKKMLPFKQDNVGEFWEFETDGVFNNSKQEQVFTDVVGDLLKKLQYGQNAVVIGFGKTGTGKSATIAGLDFSEEDYGIGPRLIKQLLQLKNSLRRSNKMLIKMSYVEFSTNDVYDLFKAHPNRIENHWGVAQKLEKIKIKNELEALQHLYAGEGRKETKSVKNYMSHINTSILTFYVTTKDMEYSEPRQTTGKVHLVDMAGSDTLGNLSCIFKTKLEVGVANLNKSYMEQFLLALCQHSNEMIKIKQRGNPLIFFLGSDVRTQSSLRFIGHISTSKDDYPLIVSMLRFGQIVRGFSPRVVNLEYEISPEHKLKYLQNKVEQLEKERIQNSVLLNQDLSLNLNCERIKHLNKTIKEYLHNEISEIDVMSVADASMIFKIFKSMLEQGETDKASMMKESVEKKPDPETKEKRTSLKKRDGSYLKKNRSFDKVDKQISIQSLEKQDTLKKDLVKGHDTSSASVNALIAGRAPKKIKSKMTAGARRRSMLSVTSSERMTDQPFLPDSIPENAEAWNDYMKTSHYNIYTDDYRANEKNITDSYHLYLSEIKQLRGYKDQIETMKQELLEARILMTFKEKSGDADKYTEAILNEAEQICKANKEKAEKLLVEQQEVVLRCLAEMKIYLNNRKVLKKKLSDDFENYCRTKFNLPIPQMKSLSELEMVKESKYLPTEVQKVVGPDAAEQIVDETVGVAQQKDQLTHLKDITVLERKKIKKSKYFSKPYILAALPEHRDAPRP